MKKADLLKGLVFFLAPAGLFFGLASAEPTSNLERGVIQYQRENYDEALELFKEAKKEDPASTRASYYLGLSYKKLQDYSQSRFHLVESVEGEPKVKEALMELVDVCYQLGQLEEAQKWIRVAEEIGMRPGQTAFIKGLVCAKENKTDDAITSFNKAKELEPALVQSADYQIGLLHLKNKSIKDAKKYFQQAAMMDPNTDIAQAASEYKKLLDRMGQAVKPWSARVGFSTEYDDNVVLKPSDTSAAASVGNTSDWREVFTVGADYQVKFSETFSAKLQYDMYLALQNDLHAFNINSQTLGVSPTFSIKENFSLGVPFQYNYTWVDDEDFVETVTFGPSGNWSLSPNQLLQPGVRFQFKNYLQVPAIVSEDRDAFRWAPSLGWFYFFNENKSFLTFRYEFDSEDTDGVNWDYDGHRLSASVQVPLVERLKLTLAGDVYWQDYSHTNTIFLVKKDDTSYTISTLLTYALSANSDIQLRYTYVKHDSNILVYDYERNIFSTGINFRF